MELLIKNKTRGKEGNEDKYGRNKCILRGKKNLKGPQIVIKIG